ncbi:type II toxin-antitoxin system VapC family toxin [Sinorhizobium fredii]|uniref:type II toxin-antitoxin system VapC family toxin n=1 Tax=Rhizobium fredii TaxID=380 RepID=UPI0005955FD2|nr:type II toxin-antitoxin system VapC family toxin [Sinorhizobium fredii]WOS62878.1 type II toxin-antitoxin system VapC family toxin [Sinorhizobium fredii GR64]
MFVDASALVAIINQGPGWKELAKRLSDVQNACFVSPLVRFEAASAVARAAATAGGASSRPTPDILAVARELVDSLVSELGAKEISISGPIGDKALDAAMTYGKAVGHPADLNFGDCFAYACAKACGVGLIYKGDDFARTDLA